MTQWFEGDPNPVLAMLNRGAAGGFARPGVAPGPCLAAWESALVVTTHDPGERASWRRRHGRCAGVTRRHSRVSAGFSARLSGRYHRDAWIRYGVCHRRVAEALREARRVAVIDPGQGRPGALAPPGAGRGAICEDIMSAFTSSDFPFVEQIVDAELEARFGAIYAILRDRRTDGDRRISALAVLAAITTDEDTIRWIATQCTAAGSDGNTVLCSLVRSEHTPVDVLVQWANVRYLEVCEMACSHERLPEAEIIRLAREGSFGQRVGVAKNSSTPAAILAELAADPDETVRACVAYSPHASGGAVAALRGDPDPWVREIASELRNAGEGAFLAAVRRSTRGRS